MSPTTPLPPPDASAFDLDERIRMAEQRVIDRDAAFRARLSEAGSRLHEATRPARLVLPVAGALLGGAALVGLLRGRGAAAPKAAAASRPAPAGSDLPWVSLIGLAWPLLPTGWRNRISPTAATTAMAVGMPLLQHLLDGGHPPLATMAHVDLARYAGTWHEIARLPAPFEAACEDQPTATYQPGAAGMLTVVNRCRKDGRIVAATGAARVEPGSGGARLQVSLWPAVLRGLPFAWAKYWILHVDDAYETALVGHPNRRFLWILARTPQLAPARLQALVDIAAQRGFPVQRLRVIPPN